MGYTHNFYADKPDLLQARIEKWRETFKSVFHATDFVLYMHHIMGHLSDRVSRYGDIDLFNIQGLEKLNDITTTQYFRGTNRKHDYISQLMYKRIRLEHYQLNQLTGKSESERVLRKRIERIEFYEKTDLFDLNELCEAEDYDEPVLVEKGKNY